MKTADLITAYLSNEMSPEQERQFLLSVAASDSLRLALKSHVMLDRIVFEQARDTRVPDRVRGVIFAEMSASLASTGSGSSAGSRVGDVMRAGASSPGVVSSVASGLGLAKGLSIALLAVTGFGAGYVTRLGVETPAAVQQRASIPGVERSAPAPQSMPLPVVEPQPALQNDASVRTATADVGTGSGDVRRIGAERLSRMRQNGASYAKGVRSNGQSATNNSAPSTLANPDTNLDTSPLDPKNRKADSKALSGQTPSDTEQPKANTPAASVSVDGASVSSSKDAEKSQSAEPSNP